MSNWLAEVLVTNLTYHVNRTRQFGKLANMVRDGPGASDAFRIPLDVYGILKQFLTARSQKIQDSDDMALSFEKTVQELAGQIEADVTGLSEVKDDAAAKKDEDDEETEPKFSEIIALRTEMRRLKQELQAAKAAPKKEELTDVV
jgi:hypothetical protein